MTHPRTTRSLDVPGATLHYETLGSGPVLALVGHPMGSEDFQDLAQELAGERTVLLHDPRGFGRSPLVDPDDDADPDVLGDDVARLLRAVGGGPAEVFGSSGGAVTALALTARHPDLVRTVVAHEPPLISALPDAEEVRAQAEAVVALLHEQGLGPAFGAFLAMAGFDRPGDAPEGPGASVDAPPGVSGDAPGAPVEGASATRASVGDASVQGAASAQGGTSLQEQSPGEPTAQGQEEAGYRLLAHGLVPVCTYPLPASALRSTGARVVLAAGEDSGAQLPRRAAEAVAAQLGTPLMEFPGDHAPWVRAMGGDPVRFAARLREVLTG